MKERQKVQHQGKVDLGNVRPNATTVGKVPCPNKAEEGKRVDSLLFRELCIAISTTTIHAYVNPRLLTPPGSVLSVFMDSIRDNKDLWAFFVANFPRFFMSTVMTRISTLLVALRNKCDDLGEAVEPTIVHGGYNWVNFDEIEARRKQ